MLLTCTHRHCFYPFLDAIARPGLSVRLCTGLMFTCVMSLFGHFARYMGLSDLLLEIKQDQNSFSGDESMEGRVLRQVLTLVEDKISEVKNQAVKT